MTDIIHQIDKECSTKEQISQVYPPELVERQLYTLIERKRKTALRTAETVMIILKEMENGPQPTQ